MNTDSSLRELALRAGGTALLVALLFIGIGISAHCKSPAVQSAADAGLRIADDVCKEEGTKPDEPDWVKIACTVDGVVTHVVLPRTAWSSVRAAARDAGPGK